MPCAEIKAEVPQPVHGTYANAITSDNKSYDTIPYMLINLGDVDTIYIGKDTLVAYIKR